jgi:hypothetical protein
MSSVIVTEFASRDGVTESPHHPSLAFWKTSMQRLTRIRRGPLRLLAPAVAIMIVLGSTVTAHAETQPQPVAAWIRHNAVSLDTADPGAGLDDLAPLGRWIGDAEIVGLGETVHGAAEDITLKHRTLRFLVEQLGFRPLIVEALNRALSYAWGQ